MLGTIEVILGVIVIFYTINPKFRNKVNEYIKKFFNKKRS